MSLLVKVFLTDGPQNPNVLCHLAQAFFVWNDVSNTLALQETA
jgi:hypothetical protein